VQDLLRRCNDSIRANPQLVMSAAEIATLSLYAQNIAKTELLIPNTRYIFLVTDTAIGRFCGDVIAQFMQYRYNANVTVHIIPGLQTDDVTRLDEALQHLQTILDDLRLQFGINPPWQRFLGWLHTAPTYQPRMVLNITGGFKVVSSWLQSYATIHGLHCMYKFEVTKRDTLIMLRTNQPNTTPRIEYFY
jgi:CRISPR/Cas system-associated protein Csm6